jgi:hypothetical protein
MLEAPRGVDAPTTGVVSGWKIPRGIAGTVSVSAALWAAGVCLHETPTAASSFCGTCRGVAQASLYGEAAWGVVASLAAAVVARFSAPIEFRVARSAAVPAFAVWVVSIGFVRGWW